MAAPASRAPGAAACACQAAPRRARRGGPDDRRRRDVARRRRRRVRPARRAARRGPRRARVRHRPGAALGARTVPVRPAPETMVATAGGLYYLADGVLYRWRDGAADSARVRRPRRIGWLSTTADGRYLAYVDHEHGPRNLGGHRIAETVVFDTTTGREVVRDAAGNGARTGTEDLSDLYGESTPTVLGFDADAVYSQTARGGAVLRWDLATGRRSALGPRGAPGDREPAGLAARRPRPRPRGPEGAAGRGARRVHRPPLPGRQPPRVHAGARPARVLLGGPPADAAGGRRAAVRAGGLAGRRPVLRPRPRPGAPSHRGGDGLLGAVRALRRRGAAVWPRTARCRCSPPATSRTDPRLVPAGMLGR